MAIDTALQIIGLRAPQFSCDQRLPDLIALATLQTGSCFGTMQEYAIALRVLHWLAIEARNGGDGGTLTSGSGVGGNIKSEKEGDLSRSYGLAGFEDQKSDLTSTAYGNELLALQRSVLFLPRTRIMSGCGE